MKTKSYKIQNLKCGGCANTIINKLSELKNISQVSVDVEHDVVHLNYINDSDLDKIIDKLASLGYPVEGEKNSITSKAKSFVSCAIGRINN